MSNHTKIFLIVLLPLFFVSCSNMTVGLEEDSRFYNGPLYDNREEANTTIEDSNVKEVESKSESSLSIPSHERMEREKNREETTFSYERDEE